MNAALKDYYLLWRMVLSIRHARTNTILFGFAVFAALCVGALVQLEEREPLHTASAAVRVALASLLGGWMMYFVPGAVKLNTPFTARMVPRMRRRLMALTALV